MRSLAAVGQHQEQAADPEDREGRNEHHAASPSSRGQRVILRDHPRRHRLGGLLLHLFCLCQRIGIQGRMGEIDAVDQAQQQCGHPERDHDRRQRHGLHERVCHDSFRRQRKTGAAPRPARPS